MSRDKPPNALRAKGVETEEDIQYGTIGSVGRDFKNVFSSECFVLYLQSALKEL
jgi:hypothetical protein